MTYNQLPSFQNGFPRLPEIPTGSIPSLKGGVSIGGEGTFGDVFKNMLGKVSSEMSKTEDLVQKAVTTGKVNLHEVMIQMSKEEVALGMTTQVASKFISTVEKLTQMQI